ncbi:MAG: protein-glutamate O-methyltransferase CheR [Rhodospirillales bacterium]|nr:protein-glutamate O-methyltransferase CheR [Rhodospirillales bacterium]MCB9997141.1 protein-glutamate O-methyltransferase CheR [Rhodospirillales bacterium]
MPVSEADFAFYKEFLFKLSGLSLTPEKNYLLESRLSPIASSLGYTDLSAFTAFLKTSKDNTVIQAVVEAMTTNETSFFRDTKPFERLKEVLPDIEKNKQGDRTIKFWSAACSSGQEAYSIAMTMQDYLAAKPGWKYQILGTDISNDILAKASSGTYNQFEVQRGLTIQMMVKFFTQDGPNWKVKDELRKMIDFKYANLLENLNHIGSFDIIMCRNVLIYFNLDTKTQVLRNIATKLGPHGYLFLGGCESIMNLDVPYKGVDGMPGIYQLAG